MTRFAITIAFLALSCGAQAAAPGDIPPARSENPVIAWNQVLLSIVRTPGAQPSTIHPTRSFAILHAAIYDAVNAIERTHAPYLVTVPGASRRASLRAAADAAAHDVLVALYPSFQSALDARLQDSMRAGFGRTDEADGLRIGRAVAREILARRQQDGADAPPRAYVFGTAPGAYQPTPPNFPPQPQFTHWPFVTPFALDAASQFRPGPAPALAGSRYAEALNEVQSVGVMNSTTATPDEAATGLFWNGAIQNYWNEIAQTAAAARHLSIGASARLFALLNISVADGVIAFYDAKYAYNLWRPVTAVREADADGNADTAGDSAWLPQTTRTAADPSYPGAHAVISAAAAEVLESVLKGGQFEFDVTSESAPGAIRSFSSFRTAATEASLSRIFAGQHFRFDQVAGEQLGRDVAAFVLDRFLTRARGRDNRTR